MKVDAGFFKNMPEYQFRIFNNLVENTDHIKIEHEDKDFEYLTTEKGSKVLVFLFSLCMWFYPMAKLKDNYKVIAPKFPTKNFGK